MPMTISTTIRTIPPVLSLLGLGYELPEGT
jgi:hypothetical protein